jgi:hypothetical protein
LSDASGVGSLTTKKYRSKITRQSKIKNVLVSFTYYQEYYLVLVIQYLILILHTVQYYCVEFPVPVLYVINNNNV